MPPTLRGGVPVEFLQCGSALFESLNPADRLRARKPQPRVVTVRSRTVAKVDSFSSQAD